MVDQLQALLLIHKLKEQGYGTSVDFQVDGYAVSILSERPQGGWQLVGSSLGNKLTEVIGKAAQRANITL